MVPGDSSSSSSSLAERQVAKIRRMWPNALKVVKAIPAASDALQRGDITMEDFFYHFGSQSLVDCELPQTLIPVGNVPRGPAAQYSSEARMLLVDELKAPFHMAKGVSYLLQHQYTFHIGLELLKVLTKLLFFMVPTVPGHPDNPSPDSTAHRSTLSTAISIATQLSSSGLLQQLPAMLQKGRQQLSSLDAFGYCGVPDCRYCSRDRRTTTSKGITNAALNPVQAHLLDLCSQVINMWPGGALSSAAVGPLLVPAAELALGSLQTATRLVQARPDSSIVPSDGMRQLGSAAFNMCFSLCSAVAAVADLDLSPHSSSSSTTTCGRLPRFAQQLLEDPVMLPVAVALGSSAVYQEHLLMTIESAKTRNADTASCST